MGVGGSPDNTTNCSCYRLRIHHTRLKIGTQQADSLTKTTSKGSEGTWIGTLGAGERERRVSQLWAGPVE